MGPELCEMPEGVGDIEGKIFGYLMQQLSIRCADYRVTAQVIDSDGLGYSLFIFPGVWKQSDDPYTLYTYIMQISLWDGDLVFVYGASFIGADFETNPMISLANPDSLDLAADILARAVRYGQRRMN